MGGTIGRGGGAFKPGLLALAQAPRLYPADPALL